MSNLSLIFNFCWKILFANNLDPDQMPHDVASDLSLHCLPMTLIRVFRYNRLHLICIVHRVIKLRNGA